MSSFCIDVDLNADIFNLKQKITEKFPNYEVNNMRIIIRGRLQDDHTILSSTTILNDPCIHLVYSEQQNQ
jgi:hypothetical protein